MLELIECKKESFLRFFVLVSCSALRTLVLYQTRCLRRLQTLLLDHLADACLSDRGPSRPFQIKATLMDPTAEDESAYVDFLREYSEDPNAQDYAQPAYSDEYETVDDPSVLTLLALPDKNDGGDAFEDYNFEEISLGKTAKESLSVTRFPVEQPRAVITNRWARKRRLMLLKSMFPRVKS